MLEQICVSLGNRETDPIGELEAGFLAHRVHPVDEVVDTPGANEVVVEVEVERDREAVRGCDGPAILAVPLDEHLLARQVVAGNANPTLRKLLEVAALKRRANGAELLPELRAEEREVRLDAKLARFDVTRTRPR